MIGECWCWDDHDPADCPDLLTAADIEHGRRVAEMMAAEDDAREFVALALFDMYGLDM